MWQSGFGRGVDCAAGVVYIPWCHCLVALGMCDNSYMNPSAVCMFCFQHSIWYSRQWVCYELDMLWVSYYLVYTSDVYVMWYHSNGGWFCWDCACVWSYLVQQILWLYEINELRLCSELPGTAGCVWWDGTHIPFIAFHNNCTFMYVPGKEPYNVSVCLSVSLPCS